MLYTLAVILLIAWLLGIVGTYTIGAFIHVLLVVAIVLFLVGCSAAEEPSFSGETRAKAALSPAYSYCGDGVRGAARSVHLVLARRFGAQQVSHEIIPPPPHHIPFVAETMAAIRQHQQIEVLVRLDERVDDEQRVVRRDVRRPSCRARAAVSL